MQIAHYSRFKFLMNIKLCYLAWFLLSLSFIRSQCHVAIPPPTNQCLSSTWMNSAPSSFPPCSLPAAAAVDIPTSSCPARSNILTYHPQYVTTVSHLAQTQKHWYTQVCPLSQTCYVNCVDYFPLVFGSILDPSTVYAKLSVGTKTETLQLWILVCLFEPKWKMQVPAHICIKLISYYFCCETN